MLRQSRVVVTTMHQGQHSSFPNCEVDQRGVKLLRLDCAAAGEWGKSRNGGVASEKEGETKTEIQVG